MRNEREEIQREKNTEPFCQMIVAVVLLILITVAVVGIVYPIVTGLIAQKQSNCYTSFAEKFCANRTLSFKSIDLKNEYFSCWVNEKKGEAKIFYIFDEKCR